MKSIKTTDTIFSIINTYPESQEVLVNLGFKPMAQMTAVNTIGKITSLDTAIKHLSLNFKDVQEAFNQIDLEVEDE